MTILLVAACAVLFAGGVVALVAGWTPAQTGRRRARRRWSEASVVQRFGARRLLLLAGWCLAGGVAASLTGWMLLTLLAPVLGVVLPALLGKPAERELELLTGLDRWVRSLTAILPTGRSIADAIRISVRQAPEALAGPLGLLVQRLNDRWTLQQALHALADDLDSADADAVLAALALAADRGGTGAHATLSALADSIQDRVRALREIETERAKPRIVVRQVTAITLAVLAAALVFGGSFFEPYRTAVGQLILAGLIAAYFGSLLLLRRMSLPRTRQRILSRPT